MLRAATDEVVVYVTVSSSAEAETIARAIVSEKLAACVNVLPSIRSFYRWEGKVQDDAELLLIVKTLRPTLNALYDKVRELHSYEVPEFVVLPIAEGSKDYLDWLAQSVSKSR